MILIVCTNLAGVQMARSLNRHREVGVRLALGASRGRVVRQLVTESLVLSFVGGALGVMISEWILIAIRNLICSIRSSVAMPLVEIRLDFRILAFALFLSIFVGIAFGILPALQTTRSNLTLALKGGGAVIGARPAIVACETTSSLGSAQ